MSSQLPPRPQGRISGFPYSILWEEFAQIWEALDQRRDPEAPYEALLAKAAPLKLCLATEPSRAAIQETIQPLELLEADSERLAGKLYRIAAAYRTPQLKKALGLGATATKSHLAAVAAAAAKLATLLESTPLELEVVLGLVRKHVDSDSDQPLFHFKDLINEATNLGAAASMVADEMPQMPRGTSANILQARLMEAATRAIGESAADCLEVLQADTAGRNPRPKSKSAHVLFAFLKLVEPSMTKTTMVRLFAGHNCGPTRVTMKQLTDLPPKSWPNHVARNKLTR
jgi:hypothetical protein